MGSSSFLFITFTLSLFSLGSLVQTSLSLDTSDSSRSTDTDKNALDNLAREVVFLSESTSDSVESSGHYVDATTSLNLIPKKLERASDKNLSGSEITLTTTPALTLHRLQTQDRRADKANASITGHTHSSVHVMTEDALFGDSHATTEEQLNQSHTSIGNDDSLHAWGSSGNPGQTNAFTSVTNQNPPGPRGPCALGLRPCVVKNFNGTNLLWDDMSRTLAFAWELHVFGSAGLFILMAVLAVLGMAGARTCPNPLCDVLTLVNILLITVGTLRGILLLLDPYGTCQILSHATLAALYNVPLQLLLWTQVALSLVTLRGLNASLFLPQLQHPWVVGALAISHCIPLVIADLYTSSLFPALPVLLQTFSLCCGLPYCMGNLTSSLSHRHHFLRSPITQWFPSQRIERRAKRLLAVCAFLGMLCCSLQVYSLLWLYGLLGNWRRFGWGWWLCQFWSRILELSWGFSMLVLGSWIWMGSNEVAKRVEEKSLWSRVLATVQKRALRKSEKTWEDLMPNNWEKYKLSRAGIRNNVRHPYDGQLSTITSEFKSDPNSNSSSDSQAALLWQKVGERECVLSLIEFDMQPPSPINLRHSIDNVLHHGQLVTAGLFTAPPPSWTQTMITDTADGNGGGIIFPPAYVGYGWMLDTESISPSLDHFQARETPTTTADNNSSIGSPATVYHGESFNSALSAIMYQHDWSDDDVTDL